MFKTTIVTFLCLIGCIVCGPTPITATTFHSNLIKWVNVTHVSISDLEPVGGEVRLLPLHNMTTYLARSVYHDSFDRNLQTGLIPGKYFLDDDEPRDYMIYSMDGIEYRSTDFEVLMYPRGSVSWIPGENVSPLDDKVVGGIDPFSSELLYLCRLAHKLNDTLARLTPGKLTTAGDCVVPYLGEITTNVNYEVLVVNAYGKYLDV